MFDYIKRVFWSGDVGFERCLILICDESVINEFPCFMFCIRSISGSSSNSVISLCTASTSRNFHLQHVRQHLLHYWLCLQVMPLNPQIVYPECTSHWSQVHRGSCKIPTSFVSCYCVNNIIVLISLPICISSSSNSSNPTCNYFHFCSEFKYQRCSIFWFCEQLHLISRFW